VDEACIGVVCPVESRCAQGQCLLFACEDGGECPRDLVCYDGACVDPACVGIACAPGHACISGHCVAPGCGGGSCPPAEACFEDACTEPDCIGIICPAGLHCVRGGCTDCGPGTYPSPEDGFCIPEYAPGEGCTAGHQCLSNACVDGTCCDGSCVAPCTRCAGGACQQRLPGEPDARCGGFLCGAAGACRTDCSGDGECAPGHLCTAEGACERPRQRGSPCARDAECQSSFCREGRCCDSDCRGGCGTCAAASSPGTCTPLPAASPCRSDAATGCDVAEACDGTALTCPADGFQPGGTPCGPGVVSDWGPCAVGPECSGQGTQGRTITSFACGSAGECTATPRTETRSCTVSVVGTPCGAEDVSAWSACSYPSTCATAGTRTRTVTRTTCGAGGACGNPQTSTESGPCFRATDGLTCGADTTYGAWSTCSGFANTCAETGSRSRDVTRYRCSGGTCRGNTSTEPGSCTRNTDGKTGCAATQTSTCQYSSFRCDNLGWKEVTTYACKNGVCSGTTVNQSNSTCVKPCPMSCAFCSVGGGTP